MKICNKHQTFEAIG